MVSGVTNGDKRSLPNDVNSANPSLGSSGFLMAHQLSGNGRSDEALGRLLGDLDDMEAAPPMGDDGVTETASPIAPFASNTSHDAPHLRAASAYEWGVKVLASNNPLRPGVIYSEKF